MDFEAIKQKIQEGVDSGIIPTLSEYIKVPSLSPSFDSEWNTNGLMQQAAKILIDYVESLNVKGFTYEIVKEEGKPDLFYGEVAPSDPSMGTVLMYGHMDKQPHFTGWMEGTGPTSPVIKDGRLYGRGGADDGYALPACGLVIKTMQELGIPHGRIIIVAENEEESGSPNLLDYIRKLKSRIGDPELIICLDSGAGNYEQLWLTSSLRGIIILDVTAEILTTGQHSGASSGVVPSSFRILRQLLDRIEDSRTGEILVPELHTEITSELYRKAVVVANALGETIYKSMPFVEGAGPMGKDLVQLVLNRTYRPTLSVTGADGMPQASVAGNVLRPSTTLRLSIRVPPGINMEAATNKLKTLLTTDVPYGAKVTVSSGHSGAGWAPKNLSPWLFESLDKASRQYFGKEMVENGEGGSIPFMGMLGDMFPEAQFVITGVLGPDSNAHAANEMLEIEFTKKLLCCIVNVLAAQAQPH